MSMQTFSVYIKGILVTNDEDPSAWDAKLLREKIEHIEVIGVAPHTVNLERAPNMLRSKINEFAETKTTKKRTYRCGACGQVGHPVSRCPNQDTLIKLPTLAESNE